MFYQAKARQPNVFRLCFLRKYVFALIWMLQRDFSYIIFLRISDLCLRLSRYTPHMELSRWRLHSYLLLVRNILNRKSRQWTVFYSLRKTLSWWIVFDFYLFLCLLPQQSIANYSLIRCKIVLIPFRCRKNCDSLLKLKRSPGLSTRKSFHPSGVLRWTSKQIWRGFWGNE